MRAFGQLGFKLYSNPRRVALQRRINDLSRLEPDEFRAGATDLQC